MPLYSIYAVNEIHLVVDAPDKETAHNAIDYAICVRDLNEMMTGWDVKVYEENLNYKPDFTINEDLELEVPDEVDT